MASSFFQQITYPTTLQNLINKGYGTIIDRNIESLSNWYDSDKSWATVSLFSSIIWSGNINQGQQNIFSSQQILFMIVSTLANIFVLTYHYTNVPHPKFALTLFSRLCIRAHVISGSIGVFVPLYVFFSVPSDLVKMLMFIFVAWDMVFALSAFFQVEYMHYIAL